MWRQNNRLFWKISATLLAMLAVLGMMYVLITGYVARQYLQEANQRLYGNIADSVIQVVNPYVDGSVDTAGIKDIMHSMMVINPSVEVYLLDPNGGIITYVAPNKRVKLERVDLGPIRTYLNTQPRPFIKGDDPRHPGEQKVFTSAPIIEDGNLTGYVYIILASEEQAAVTSSLYGSYMLKLGSSMFFLTLITTLLLGLLAIWFLTRSLRNIIGSVRRFKEGDYSARISNKDKKDFQLLGDTFNEMSDTIVANIEQLQSVEKLRRELIANVSHDLRTPLAILQGYIETLLMKNESFSAEDRQRYLNIVLDSSEKLSSLIAQLFEYSKLEAKQIEPQKEPFFLSELAQDIQRNYQMLAKEKNITMDLEAPANLPMVFADLSLVERVIQNLLDNAIKFTPEGGKVTLALEESDHSVTVKIVDTGPGIPAEDQSYIFERYRRTERTKGKKEGAGLGLAIVKKILELHDASIQVQSQLNEGTAFIFQLPAYSHSS